MAGGKETYNWGHLARGRKRERPVWLEVKMTLIVERRVRNEGAGEK